MSDYIYYCLYDVGESSMLITCKCTKPISHIDSFFQIFQHLDSGPLCAHGTSSVLLSGRHPIGFIDKKNIRAVVLFCSKKLLINTLFYLIS